MARRSREDMAAEKLRREQQGKRSKLYSTAIYARLSIEKVDSRKKKKSLRIKSTFARILLQKIRI